MEEINELPETNEIENKNGKLFGKMKLKHLNDDSIEGNNPEPVN